MPSLAQPDPETAEVYIGVSNESSNDTVLQPGVLIGQVELVSHDDHTGKEIISVIMCGEWYSISVHQSMYQAKRHRIGLYISQRN